MFKLIGNMGEDQIRNLMLKCFAELDLCTVFLEPLLAAPIHICKTDVDRHRLKATKCVLEYQTGIA